MEWTEKQILDTLRLIEASDYDEVKLEVGDFKLHVRRRGTPAIEPRPEPPALVESVQHHLDVRPADVDCEDGRRCGLDGVLALAHRLDPAEASSAKTSALSRFTRPAGIERSHWRSRWPDRRPRTWL